MDMIETTIQLKDEKDWPEVDIQATGSKTTVRRRRTPDELADAMNAAIQFPGLVNAWTMPIRTRIDMLATGIKTPVGIKVAGPSLAELERIASEIEPVIRQLTNTASAYAERVMGGNYIEFNINRDEIARYGLSIGAVQDVLEVALGGMPLTTTVGALHGEPPLRPRFPGEPGGPARDHRADAVGGAGSARPARPPRRRARPDGHQERGRGA
jgi:Cu(I)/Ag(I) efflux system membrane protein CusA/SilA